MMNRPKNKTEAAAQAAKVQNGLKIHFTKGSQVLPLAGGTKPTTVTALTTAMGQLVSNRTASVAAKAASTKAVATENEAAPALIALLQAIIAYVRLTLGGNPQALEDFGLAPHKARATTSAEAKTLAVAKRMATRQARGTIGPKKKAQIHGNVTGITVTPETSAPSPSPAPAAGAAPAVLPAAGATKPAS